MKNLQFFLMFFMMVFVGQQVVALQTKSTIKNNTFVIDCGGSDCTCSDDTPDED